MSKVRKENNQKLVNSALKSLYNFLEVDAQHTLSDFAKLKGLDLMLCNNDWEKELK